MSDFDREYLLNNSNCDRTKVVYEHLNLMPLTQVNGLQTKPLFMDIAQLFTLTIGSKDVVTSHES